MSQRSLFDSPRRPLSVSELTTQIKDALEAEFPEVWVTGEISNLTPAASGHLYFTLKDADAQLKAIAWRSTAARIPFRLEDGLEVICRGALEVYAPRGQYQLIAREVQPKGEGALQLALRQLRERLAKEGLFAAERKRPLPAFPRRVGFVTSPSGAAVHDFLQVARRRWPGMHVLVIPARVQGEGAAAEIVRGIELANRLSPPLDVLVVGRGGGSLEDLWCFNEEPVVRAIFASRVPVVSAVGHEIDVTLSDLVADVRALTPSEAAERIYPVADELRSGIAQRAGRLLRALQARLQRLRLRVDALAGQRVLRRPFDLVHERSLRVDELERQAARAMVRHLERRREQLARLAAQLESLSPLAVLGRGYSLTRRAEDGTLLREAAQVAPGDLVATQLASGAFTSRVESVQPE